MRRLRGPTAVRRVHRAATLRQRLGEHPEAGSAVVEFLGVALVLLVPIVYLVLVLARLQSAAFAVDGAAREGVRAFVTTAAVVDGTSPPPGADAASRAVAAAGIALGDQGLAPGSAAEALTLTCAPDCTTPGADVTAVVSLPVALPGVPEWLRSVVPLEVTVDASATGTVPAFGAGG